MQKAKLSMLCSKCTCWSWLVREFNARARTFHSSDRSCSVCGFAVNLIADVKPIIRSLLTASLRFRPHFSKQSLALQS